MMDAPRLFIKDPQDNLITVISEGYFDVKLTSYLTGAATTLSFSFVKDSESYEQIVTGCKVAFIYNEKDYWMNIVNVYQDEDIMTVTAWGVSLELSNETVAPYKATKPMSFEEYANLWNYEKTFEIGINEVSDKRITHEWENGDKTLGRLLSLAKVFDAEIEFVTYLDDFHNLDRLVMNVYRAHSETNQGMGLDSRQLVYRFGKDIDTITKEEDSSELYTCITPTGKDGINISSIEFEKFDAEGNLEFCTYKTAKPDFPDVRKIYAPLAKLRHPSYRGQTRDEWTNLNWETEYTTANDLSGNALAKIKEVSAPTFTWNINGVIEAGIGDVVTIEDDGYQPTLYLEARVSEQTIDFSDTSKNQTTFTNVLEVGSAVDSSLLSRMEALIEANKTYVGSIQSTNGIVFKNNSGTTDLTAVVRIGTEDVTNNFNIIWYKDGVQIATTPTITVTATDVVERALYKFEAKDSEGVVKAFYEVTVSDVSDGDDGRGISSTKVEYQSSTSGTEVPKGAWVTNPPTVSAGQYLWTRTTFTYTDSSTTLSYSISRMGADGEGVGIADVTITYQAGTSGTTPPTGEWTSSIPSVAANQFLWTRTVTTYTDGETSTAYSVGKMGANGADAQLLYLSASSNVMSFDSDDIVVPDQTVTITANLQNASGTVIWKAIPYIGSSAQNPITLTGTGNTRTLSSGLWTNPQWTLVAITATVGSLTDTVSVVKVADGKAVYLHTAWLMPDGTFIKDYPNENELPNSKSPKFSAYSGSSMTYTENVSVPEWGATDAVQHKVSGGTYETISGLLAAGSLIDLNTKYVHSMYIKNVGTTVVRISNNLSETLEIAPNETKRLVFAPASKDSGRAAKQFTLYRLNSTDVQEFIVWHAKIEKSDSTATVWTPMPSEDPVNAYPKYAGEYSDHNETASSNPDDYEPWQVIRGEEGAAGQDAKEVFSGYLTNEAVVLPANASGAVTDFSKATGSFVTFLGQTQLTSGVTYTMESSSGITATINQTTGDYAITAMTASVELGTAIFKATYDGISIKKQVIVTKAKQGGAGVGLISTAVTYQAGASGTTPPTGTWVASVPTVPAGQFLWTRTIWTFSDNTTKTGYSIGKVGETGATGNGIASSAITYAASTSGTSAPTSGWQATIPTVAAGSFLWTRTILTYTNGSTNTSYAVAKQGEKGDPTGIVVQSTVPTADQRYVGMLWRNTGASGYIKDATYRWNGSAFELYVFIAENISVDNLAAITGRIGEIYNDYSRTYNDNTTAIGTLAIKNAEISNTGKIRNSSGVITQSYESIYSHQLIAMSRYEGSEAGDQNKLLASAGLTFDTLSLMNKDTGFSGTLTAEMLYDTGWINLPLLKGSGQIRVRKFMKRYLIQFADYAWNGTGPNQPADAIAVLPPANNPGRDQLFNVKVWSIDPQRVDAFQLNKDGRLYKLSNNSQTLYYRNTVEVFD